MRNLVNTMSHCEVSCERHIRRRQKERTAEHQQLLKATPSVNITSGNLYQYIPDSKPKLAEFDEQIKKIRSAKPVEQFIRALVEPANHVTQTALFHRGDPAQPRQVVPPGALTVLAISGHRSEFASDDSSLPTTGRRLAFARWLTSENNPLLAKVIVNRIWDASFWAGIGRYPRRLWETGNATRRCSDAGLVS